MQPKNFISKLEEEKIVTAIAEAEKTTSGEIRVYISSKKREDALAAARNRFEKLGMTKTKLRNGVLIFIAPATQKFAIIGDSGIHQQCGEEFWKEITMAMRSSFKEGQFTEAITSAVREVGAALARHFPPGPDDVNELPNTLLGD
ncbi:MAG: TPM domain-containing protein [Verrucomicrobiota bacterium]